MIARLLIYENVMFENQRDNRNPKIKYSVKWTILSKPKKSGKDSGNLESEERKKIRRA
jgi:hypothetical protein